jgi:ubiquinone/menaquinone biosynthesis C-methylase UbiE/broad specificity phosphatase PhoE
LTQVSGASLENQNNSQSRQQEKANLRLLLICHAEGLHDRYVHLGSESSGLTALGWEQSNVLASWLRTHETVDTLICDNLLQSRLTAQRIGQALDMSVAVFRDLPSKLPHSQWNMPGTATEAPRQLGQIVCEPAPIDDTPYAEYHRALVKALDKLLQEHWGKTIAIVTSAESIGTIVRHMFGGHQLDIWLNYTSITEILHFPSRWTIHYVNRMEHLPSPVIAPRDVKDETAATSEEIEDLSSVIQVYNRVAGGDFEQKRADDRNRIRHLLNFGKLPPGLHILDVGTGLGVLAIMLAEDGAESVIGIDVSPGMLEQAEYLRLSLQSEAAQRVSFRLAPVQMLPFQNERFDAVTCRLLLHHSRKPERILREIARVLRPGGLLVLAELLSIDNSVKRATQNAIEERRNPSHVTARSAEQYNKLVTDAGLTIEMKDTVGFERELEEWLAAYRSDRSDAAVVREMVEAGLETDAAGMNPRRQGNTLVFEQRIYYIRAVKS